MNRESAINKWRNIAKFINMLCDIDCEGVPDVVLHSTAQYADNVLKNINTDKSNYSIYDVADKLGVTIATVHKWQKQGKLPKSIPILDQNRVYLPKKETDIAIDKIIASMK